MKVVILCGGKGTRMNESTKSLPKPLVRVGAMPILWHIMMIYSHEGFNEFILCLGYKGEKIKEFFKKYKKWDIVFADTGRETNTGGRIKRIEKYIKEDWFFATYGDGLADINLPKLLDYHKRNKKIATLTAVKPRSPFGILEINSNQLVTSFDEKPVMDHWINGGFFVFDKRVFGYIGHNDVLEREVFERLAKDRNVCAFPHKGFWECMDTYKDNLQLNELWRKGHAEWAVWHKGRRRS